ncbi:MAG: 30S ribosomal protein S4 [Patescibacteria group bacterium]
MQKGVVRKRRPGALTEYGRQLKEKQELRGQYNLRERQFKRYVKGALEGSRGGDASERFLQLLERRLDNVIFRAGIAKTRTQARQMASHGHFLVNGRRTTIPSVALKKGDIVQLHPSSTESPLFKEAKLSLQKYEPPSWLMLNKETLEIQVQGQPSLAEIAPSVEIPLVFEYYSR